MKTLVLKIKKIPRIGIEVEDLKPESFIGKTLNDIETISVYTGNKEGSLKDFFDIEGEIAKKVDEQLIVIEGDASRIKRIGESMNGGEIIIKGNIGLHLGEFMQNGKIMVEGDAKGWIGTSMNGGEIIINGNCGSHIGCARIGETQGMKDGKIMIKGDVQHNVGYGLLGGEIIIEGNVESFVGSYMKKGVIKIRNLSINGRLGYGMTGGKIFVNNKFKVPFYFSVIGDEKEYRVYKGDLGFNGEGLLYILMEAI